MSRTIRIEPTDSFRFTPDHLDVRSDETVAFEIHNPGVLAHEFFTGTPQQQVEHERDMASVAPMHAEAGQVDVAAGQTARLIYTFEQQGTLEFVCHLPGHYPAGMLGTISVTA